MIKNKKSILHETEMMVTENVKVILKSGCWNYSAIEKFLEIEPFWDGRRGMIDAGLGQQISNVRIILHERNSKMQNSMWVKRGAPLVILPEFRMGQYWDDDHREDALHIIFYLRACKNSE